MLPFWLNHHKKYFDDGIIIDYDSTDSSLEIIKSICPKWTILKSRNKEFDAHEVDQEIMDIENSVSGLRICLNTTEFLVGDFDKVADMIIPSIVMVDEDPFNDKIIEDLVKEKTFGIPYEDNKIRGCRCMHSGGTKYSLGRHFHNPTTNDFLVLWYGFSPFNEEVLKRKLQVQNKISERDKRMGHGFQHIATRESLINVYNSYKKQSKDLKDIINGNNN